MADSDKGSEPLATTGSEKTYAAVAAAVIAGVSAFYHSMQAGDIDLGGYTTTVMSLLGGALAFAYFYFPDTRK